jgi:hypothetical protein
VSSPSADTRVDGPRGGPRAHPGLRHGVVLALCAVLPIVHAMGAATSQRSPGFPAWGLVLLVAATTVGAGVLGVDAPRPGLRGIGSRIVGAAVLAVVVRLTVPSPGVAIAEVREGAAFLVSGVAIVTFGALLLGFAVGHLVASRTVVIARGRPTLDAARADDRQLVVSAWGTALTLLLVAGLTHRTTGTSGTVLLGVTLIVGLVTVADLRAHIPPPGGASRPAVVATPTSIGRTASVLAAAAVVVGTALTVPVVPAALQEGLGRPSEWTADLFDRDWSPQRSPAWSPEELPERRLDRERSETIERHETLEDRSLSVPPWLSWVLTVVLVALLLVVLRPDRWGRALRRMWGALRHGVPADDDTRFEPLQPIEDDAADDGPAGRFRGALDRVRLRPRDPRQAIVHDYLRIDRLLAREELGRAIEETPLEHAARLRSSAIGGLESGLAELAGLVSAARYGRSAPAPSVADRSRELQQLLERELRARR